MRGRFDFGGWRCKTRGCGFYIQVVPSADKLLAIVSCREPTVPAEIDHIHGQVITAEVVTNFPGRCITIFHLAQGCVIICADAREENLTAPGRPDEQWRTAITEAVIGKRLLTRGGGLSAGKLGVTKPTIITLALA
jgi:hypothetical protein